MLLPLLTLLSTAQAAYITPRYAREIQAALPLVKQSALQPVILKLQGMDPDKPYTGHVLSYASTYLWTKGGIGPSADLRALSDSKKGLALTKGLAECVARSNAEAGRVAALAKVGKSHEADAVIIGAMDAEQLLVYAHPFLKDENHKALREAYGWLRGIVDIMPESFELLRPVLAAQDRLDEVEPHVHELKGLLARERLKDDAPNRRSQNLDSHGLDWLLKMTLGYSAVNKQYTLTLQDSAAEAGSLLEALKRRRGPDSPTREEAIRLLGHFTYLTNEYIRFMEAGRDTPPEDKPHKKAAALRMLEMLRDLAE